MTANQQRPYEAMKSRLIQLLNEHGDSYQLSELLNFQRFSEIINSPRDYSNIKRIEDLICLLERRNAINASNVASLAQICALIILQNDGPCVREAQTLVNNYKKTYKLLNCEFCGSKNDNHRSQEMKKETRSANRRSSVETVVRNLESSTVYNNNNAGLKWWDRVGFYCDWNVLRRLPGLTEKDLNRFRERYSEEYGECQLKAFEYWLQKGGEHVKIETLMKALTDTGNGHAAHILIGLH